MLERVDYWHFIVPTKDLRSTGIMTSALLPSISRNNHGRRMWPWRRRMIPLWWTAFNFSKWMERMMSPWKMMTAIPAGLLSKQRYHLLLRVSWLELPLIAESHCVSHIAWLGQTSCSTSPSVFFWVSLHFCSLFRIRLVLCLALSGVPITGPWWYQGSDVQIPQVCLPVLATFGYPSKLHLLWGLHGLLRTTRQSSL